MKYYEHHYDEYLSAIEYYDLHPELSQLKCDKREFGNMIIHGPPGTGKYTQSLRFLKPWSPSDLKYDKTIICQTEKQQYKYHISDIHYEVDMALLGCNSKIIWHEIFMQIVDIVSMKQNKLGVIVCKNFHSIHTELLEIFYSYMQTHSTACTSSVNAGENPALNISSPIQIKYILLTEHVSFMPNTILNSCQIVSVRRPSKEDYCHIASCQTKSVEITTPPLYENVGMKKTNSTEWNQVTNFFIGGSQRRSLDADMSAIRASKSTGNLQESSSTPRLRTSVDAEGKGFQFKIAHPRIKTTQYATLLAKMEGIETSGVINAKEIRSISMDQDATDVFNIICDNIIEYLSNPAKIKYVEFRDIIYDILIYNLDASECIWYILSNLIQNGSITDIESISDLLKKTHPFLKYYNNNYRPIYHLESILFYIISKL
jgi:hypothetical protein